MFVTHLSLADFRSYASLDVPLEAGVTVFTGANGQGKTNIVEAIDYLATLGSHRVSSEQPLIRFGAEQATVRARVQAGLDDSRSLQLEVILIPGRANKASLNRSPLKRPRDLLGALRTVFFAPDDLALVKGDPASRRRFVDELVVARWPRLAGVMADYDRVQRQRTTLLKSLYGRSIGLDTEITLEVWDEQLARFGAEILTARLATVTALADPLAVAYADIAPTNSVASVVYKSALEPSVDQTPDELAAMMRAAMVERRREELARGMCLVGPHRDDLYFGLGAMPAKGYASHGESWSVALSARLAALAVLRADGVDPVLVLDDVFAELDEVRRERLASHIGDAEQILITAAVAADVPGVLGGRRLLVQGGEVVPA
ncbi:MAG: DNA replication/repair protein RecF [Propionibacteriaceae bacterium]|nr:DNA replication/repair protein RecF [Micropruina sp.]HBX81185.1 DNA replication/repair protein RecF [Propionibacteriaceae bacterium]HBY24291.1 DNA replication/repair protein RecF [Propionibacteriaceae bacterium]